MDKKNLLKDRLSLVTRDVEIPGVGTIVVRGLSRFELMLAAKNTEDAALIERRNLSMAIVDPKLTEDEVEQWQRNAPAAEIGPVTDAIRDLSGLGEGAGKSDVSEVRE